MLHRKSPLRNKDTSRCGNCHAYLGESKFCVYCGTKAGEGAYLPFEDIIQCVYGPPPVEREHVCTVCGHVWTDCAMIDRVKFCPECGGSVKTRDLGSPWSETQNAPVVSAAVQEDMKAGNTITFGKVNQNAGRSEDKSEPGSSGDSGHDGLPSDPA